MWLKYFIFLTVLRVLTSKKITFQHLTSIQLTSQHKNSVFQDVPYCVIFKDSSEETQIEKNLSKFLEELDDESFYSNWNFAVFDRKKDVIPISLYPGLLPVLQCYTGHSGHLQYRNTKPCVKSLRKWLKSVERVFSKRIPSVTSKSMEALISEHQGLTVIGIPGCHFQSYLENILKQVRRDWKGLIQAAIVPSLSEDESDICLFNGIHELPAFLIFDKQEWDESKRPVVVLQGQLNVGEDQLRLELTIRNTQATVLTLANFEKEVLNTGSPTSPIAITFYSHRNPRSFHYMDKLSETIGDFAKIDASFRFGVVNLATNRDIVTRYVNASLATSVPFMVIFWQEKHQSESKYVIKQVIFATGIPTLHYLYNFLISHNVPLLVDEDADVSWLEKKELTCDTVEPVETACAVHDNVTYTQPAVKPYGPELAPPGWTDIMIAQHVSTNTNKSDPLPVVTDKTWSSKIEQSVKPTKIYGIPIIDQQNSKSYHVSLVVFVKDNCGYCAKIMPVLQDIYSKVKLIGVSMYVMNCSTDPVHCQQHGVTGFPTLTAFRSLSWSLAEHCFPSDQQSRYIRIDYHGAIVPSMVLDWLSNINTPAVNKDYVYDHLPNDMNDDVYLVATLYSRALARRYLSSRLIDKWYSYQCYTIVCELLYGLVPCYALYTRDVVDHVGGTRNDNDLVVSKLLIHRKDGVRATIFELGYDLAFTLSQDTDSRLHAFHQPHRYDVRSDFKCEDDHRKCTNYIVQFVRDHRRLPVIQITTDVFHTKTGVQDTSEVFTRDLPVMLILAHRQNISRDSQFYKELTTAAYSLYQDMVFATVNVDEFSYWASKFVPKDYGNQYAFDTSFSPSLYHYPRLCIVRWHDHQHAALYPSVDEMERLGSRAQERLDRIDSQQIIKFAQDFLNNPDKAVIRTEMF